MADVIDLKTRRKSTTKKQTYEERELAAAEEAVGPFANMVFGKREPTMFDFDWASLVTRVVVGAGSGYDDEMSYSQAGRDKFVEIFMKAFGFPRLPRTLGEFNALWDYCSALDSLARTGSGVRLMAANWPNNVPMMKAYVDGNRFELKRLHSESYLLEIARIWASENPEEE